MREMLRVASAACCMALLVGALHEGGNAQVRQGPDSAVRAQARWVFDKGTSGSVGPTAVRVPFAVVNYAGVVDSKPSQGQFLYRHYPFGWQLIARATRFRACDLLALGVPIRALPVLDAIGSLPARNTACPAADVTPSNPTTDEIAVRALMHQRTPHAQVGPVAIAGSYALAGSSMHGGSHTLFHKRHATWHLIGGGGGSITVAYLVRIGLSPREAHVLEHRYRMADISPG